MAGQHCAGDERHREAVLVPLEGGANEEHEGGLVRVRDRVRDRVRVRVRVRDRVRVRVRVRFRDRDRVRDRVRWPCCGPASPPVPG